MTKSLTNVSCADELALQLMETPSQILHYDNCANGLTYYCDTPKGYDNYGFNERECPWMLYFCQPDNFGNLVPIDIFYHGSEYEQNDIDLCNWLGVYDINNTEPFFNMKLVGFYVIDKLLNLFLIEHVDDYGGGILLSMVTRGPYFDNQRDGWFTKEEREKMEFRLVSKI